MAIPDPHAIPETEASAQEYLQEADQAWDSGDNDHAFDVYYSLRQAQFVSGEVWSHASYRLGLISQTRGNTDLAVQFLAASHAPGAAEALHALTNVTTNDPTPDADQIPATAEQFLAWLQAAEAAQQASDWPRAYGLFTAAAQSPQAAPGQVGYCYEGAGLAAEHNGDQEGALRWYEQALPLLPGGEQADSVRKRIQALGGGQTGAADASAAAAQVAAGINAYENGDAAAAHADLSAALHLEGPDDQKARARYYLAAMDYQAGRYADARVHVEAAASGAPEPERTWAQGMLEWRWDEHPAAASAAAATPAPTAAAPTAAAPPSAGAI